MTWETVPLGDVAEIVGGATPKTGESRYWDGGIPWATPAEISKLRSPYIEQTQRTISEEGLASSGVRILPPNSVLLSSRAPIGLVAINRVPMGTNQGFKSLVPGPRIDTKYLYWWLRSHTALLQSKGRGATFLEVSKAEVERVPVTIPPLPEQRRIAAILDEADALRTARTHQLALANDAVDQHVAQIIDRATDRSALGSILSEPFRNGISPSRSGTVEAEVLTLSAITRGAFDRRYRKTDSFAVAHTADKLVTAGLHLICRGNGNPDLVGVMVAATDTLEGVAFPDTMIAMRPSSVISSATLLAAWRGADIREQIRRGARTTNGTYKVNQQLLGSILVPIPTAVDQAAIDSMEAERGRLNQAVLRSAASSDSLFASLQHRAFRGEL